MRISTAILLLVLVQTMVGCGSSPTSPAQPPTTTSITTAPLQLAVFNDPASSFSTSDVRDVGDEVVRFNIANDSLIWAADGRSFPGFHVSGNFVGSNFQIRFGMKDGEQRGYFTETATGTICDVGIVGNQLLISPTNVTVPGGG